MRSRRKKRALAVKVVGATSDLNQHQQPGICDPDQSFENHAWKRCSHNFHRFIIVLAHYRLRPYRMFWLYPHASLGRAQCLCRDRPSQMARSWSAHSAWKRCWTNSERRLQRQSERQLFKKRPAIWIQYLANCCVHIGWNFRFHECCTLTPPAPAPCPVGAATAGKSIAGAVIEITGARCGTN